MSVGAHVFIQTAFLGDVILSVPFLKNWSYILGSEKKKILICRQGVGSFLKDLGLVDEVFEIQKGHRKTYGDVLKKLKSYKIETLISAHQSIRTTLFALQIKAEVKIGYKNFYSWLAYQQVVERDKTLPESLRLLQLLAPMDRSIEGLIADFRLIQFPYEYEDDLRLKPPPHWARLTMRELIEKKVESRLLFREFGLDEGKRWVVLFPGSVWATKRWIDSGFVEVAQKLVSNEFGVLLMGGPEENHLCESIRTQVDSSLRNRVVNLAGRTSILNGLGILSRCELAVSNDSAGAHMASLAGIRVLAIFGPTVLDFGYRPWADESYIVEQKDLFCRPCGPHGHKKCPLGTHECMKELSPESVLNVIWRVLKSPEFQF